MKSKMKKRTWVAVALIALILTASVGGTLAYLMAQTSEVVNTFNPSKVTSQVVETLNGNVKNNVMIKNTGDVDAFIRAAVVVTWQDAQGNVYPKTPGADDYSIKWNISENDSWFEKDGFYYYKNKVEPNGTTGVLFTECTPLNTEPEGYTLHVEILGSAIQADGMTTVDGAEVPVVTAVWGVKVDGNGNLTPNS